VINVFVHHEKYNAKGNLIDEVTQKKNEEEAKGEEYDSEEEEEEIDYEKDESEEDKLVTSKYIVDMIAYYLETSDELMLHWGTGRKVANEWVAAEDRFLPLGSKKWPDGKAVQTPF